MSQLHRLHQSAARDQTRTAQAGHLALGSTRSAKASVRCLRQRQHLAFSTEYNYPLPNLFVSMLQRMGIDADKFASSPGTMRGLELA